MVCWRFVLLSVLSHCIIPGIQAQPRCLPGQFLNSNTICTGCPSGTYSIVGDWFPQSVIGTADTWFLPGVTFEFAFRSGGGFPVYVAGNGYCIWWYYSAWMGSGYCNLNPDSIDWWGPGGPWLESLNYGAVAPLHVGMTFVDCSGCRVGTYNALTGQTACKLCPTFTYGDSPSATACIACPLCPAGSFSTCGGLSTGDCLPCPVGTFSGVANVTTCQSCTSGTFSITSGTSLCTQCAVCPPGNLSTCGGSKIGDCSACLKGTFSALPGLSSCAACSTGTFASDWGSSSCITCMVCPAGQSSGCGGTLQGACAACPVSSYTATPGATACVACPFRTYTPQASSQICSACPACPIGTYISWPCGGQNTGECSTCALGKYSSVPESAQCATCAVGTYAGSTTACSTCPVCVAGKYILVACSGALQGNCSGCLPGTYSGVAGAYTCTQCASNTYSVSAMATACVACMRCPAGQSSGCGGINPGACAICPIGTYAASGATACTACEYAKYMSQTGASVCNACPVCSAGQASGCGGTKGGGCAWCQIGKYSGAPGAFACSDCELNTYVSWSRATACLACVLCNPGESSGCGGGVQGSCAWCVRGLQAPTAGMTACLSCPVGMFSFFEGSTQCYTCTTCNPGTYRYNCGDGTRGGGICSDCEPGTYSNAYSASVCSDCPYNTFQPDPSKTFCYQCVFVTSNPGSYMQVPCGKGNWGSPAVCNAGTYTTGQTETSCTTCVGSYQPASGQTGCLICSAQCTAGYYKSPPCGGAVDGICVACSIGTYASLDGATQCLACICTPGGFFSTTCGSNNPGTCTACPIGYYTGLNGLSVCSACSSGTYSTVSGASACLACICAPGGFFSTPCGTNNPGTCTACPIGYYTGLNGLSVCSACIAQTGYSSVSGSSACTACTLCRAGNSIICGGSSSGQCLACGQGTYTGVAMLTACVACSSGTYASFNGATICLACTCAPGGYYATPCDTKDPGNCTPCPKGYYTSSSGLSACSACIGQTYSSSSGSSACTACAICRAGSTIVQPCGGTTAGNCTPCGKGSFSGLDSSTVCTSCQQGVYANQTASTSCPYTCDACPPTAGGGNYFSFCRPWMPGRCALCPDGTYSYFGIQCMACPTCSGGGCPAGSYAPASLAFTTCSTCAPATFSTGLGMLDSTEWVGGAYTFSTSQPADCRLPALDAEGGWCPSTSSGSEWAQLELGSQQCAASHHQCTSGGCAYVLGVYNMAPWNSVGMASIDPNAVWIWSTAGAASNALAETVTLSRSLHLPPCHTCLSAGQAAINIYMVVDNRATVYVNGALVINNQASSV
jgi:hypothetical protein